MATWNFRTKHNASWTNRAAHAATWKFRQKSDFVPAGEFDIGTFDLSEFDTVTGTIATVWTFRAKH